MRIWRSLCVAALAAAMLAPLARAQSDEEKKEETRRQRIRAELVEKLDKRLQTFRNEMIEEIDRALERRGDRVPERTTRPQPGTGDRPLLGVTLKPLSEGARTLLDLPEGVGVMVDEVREGSAAEKAGIQKGDILLAWNGETIKGAEDMGRFVKGAKPGDKVKLTVLHRGAKTEVEAILGSAPGAAEAAPERDGGEGKTGPREGEGLEDFLERVLKDGEKDGGKKEEGERPTPPFSFGGDPKQLEDLMKQFFGGDPEQMEEMQKRAQEMMKQFFGKTPEEQEEAMKRAQEMMKQLFGEEGPNMEDLKKMLEGFRGGEGPGPEGDKPADREGADRLNKLLDEVLKGQQGDGKEPEGKESEAPKGKAFLGISLAPVTPAIRSQMNVEEGAGVLVAGVLADGPAAQGGLEKNDVIVAIDGKKIASIEDVAGIMAQMKPGQEVTLKIVRAVGEVEKKVTLGDKK